MPRRKNFSHKFKKAQLQDARAVKRGDLTIEEAAAAHSSRRTTRALEAGISRAPLNPAESSSRRHTSRFVTVSPDYLDRTRILAFSEALPRPLPPDSAIFPVAWLEARDQERRLTVPARPRFRFGQTKKELERNEEGMFRKWLGETDGVMQEWVEGEEPPMQEGLNEDGVYIEPEPKWPRGPSWFETNLEVWRQL
jgi:hypothetical protein